LLLAAQCFPRLTKVTRRDKQHSKAFTVLFVEVFVVNLVGLSDGHQVRILGALEPREAAVDEDIMYQKVGCAVESDPRANPKPEVCVQTTGDKAVRTWDGENQKEGIVFLEKARTIAVVVFVEKPHGAVHQVFVGQPSHALHGEEGDQCD
jgi:hypothetical protein